MNVDYEVIFHDWVYLDTYEVTYYGSGLTYSNQIHYVRDKGEMDNRNQDLLQLAIL